MRWKGKVRWEGEVGGREGGERELGGHYVVHQIRLTTKVQKGCLYPNLTILQLTRQQLQKLMQLK